MLIEFTVGNYLSFKEKKTLSLEAANITEYPDNVIHIAGTELLKSVAVYGANSSGKSNLLKAIEKMVEVVKTSSKKNSTDKIGIVPFLLNSDTPNQPSLFEILFFIDSILYRYGFEVTDTEVKSEWLFSKKENEEEFYLFIREGMTIELSDAFQEGKGLEQRKNSNMLFLATVDQFGGRISNTIITFFNSMKVVSGLQHATGRLSTYLGLNSNNKTKNDILQLLKSFDLGFDDLHFNPLDKNNIDISMDTIHPIYDDNGKIIGKTNFDSDTLESAGTNKILDFIGEIYLSLSKETRVLTIDELDAKLHPILTNRIIKLFNSPDYNKKNSQLIFATHDTNLLSKGDLRRDQIYFAEKDRFESTDLYSLVEYKMDEGVKVRKDRSFEKDYLQGRYGAIPFLGDISHLFNSIYND